MREARSEAERTTGAAKRELDDLTRQQDSVRAQLGQLFQGLAGFAQSANPGGQAPEQSGRAESATN
jgi:hypothetical protein